MALADARTAPPDVPTTYSSPKHANDFEVPGPATIRFANKDLIQMDEPPLPGQHIKVELTLKRKGGAFDDIGDDGETSWACRTVLVAAKLTREPYEPVVADKPVTPKTDENQPALYDENDDEGDEDQMQLPDGDAQDGDD